jgi:hypothetical protein
MIKAWLERHALKSKKKRLDKIYLPLIKAKEHGSPEWEEIYTQYLRAISFYEPELRQVTSKRLNRKAIKFGIDIKFDEWYISHQVFTDNGSYMCTVLTPLGEIKLRRLIRDERRNNIGFWVKILAPIITALTGLAGAIIGLLAIIKAWKG